MPIKKVRLTTTLALLKQHRACASGYKKLLVSLPANYPQDKPINLLRILESNGVQDMMWALRATEQDDPKVRVAICADMAARVLHHFEAPYPDDQRPRNCIEACKLFVRGKISLEALQKAANAAAYAAVCGADAAAIAAAYAAKVAAYAATVAICAVDVVDVDAERAAQARIIRKYLC